ncbi:protein mono-ADP-ribosyltransferase PARP10 [Rana temporaria]|uniref:protein mono-ADP-ribosyltransferase PARP10 n=1 Tax=Rana temporaria TaxID=8407 RepID=UPI001AACC9CD|nr:protein mono-ADP-ribosyltransferase PARP10 [Rana temporaria]
MMDVRAEVEVLGLTEDVDNEFLHLYFENKRRSGGGAIQSVSRNGSVGLITFSDPGDAERVLSKGEHRLNHVTVQVRRPPPWDPRMVALCGLDPDITEALLELYVEAVSGRQEFSVLRSADKTAAIVSFQQELSQEDLNHIFTRVEEKKLHDRSISVLRVRASGDILVGNIGSQITEELLEMYFESKRSGGGALRSVTVLREEFAVVSFHDWNVVDQVLGRQHTLQNCQLSVSRYYPDLLGSPGHDLAQERDMEEEEPTKTLDTVIVQQSGGQVLVAPDEDRVEPNVPGKEEQLDEMECDGVEETQNGTHYEVPETPQIGPHSQASSDEPGTPRTLHSPDTGKDQDAPPSTSMSSPDTGEDQGAPPSTSMSLGDEGRVASDVHEAEVVMEAAELSFMQRYHHELLAGMDAVTIFPLEENYRFGFKVVGDTFSCRTAVELLQHVVSSFSSRTITLEYPWVTHFLVGGDWKRILRDTEKQYHCIISTPQLPGNLLDCEHIDPWSFVHGTAAATTSSVQSMVMDEVPDVPLFQADMEGIKRFATLLKSEEKPIDIPSSESSTSIGQKIHKEDSEEDLYTDDPLKEKDSSTISAMKDEEMDQAYEMSRREYTDRELDEEAQLLLAIQRSMDSQGPTVQEEEEEDEELQRVLEMSLIQHQSPDAEESFQRALEMSLQDQTAHDNNRPNKSTRPTGPNRPIVQEPAYYNEAVLRVDLVEIKVLAGDETSIVVASTAIRKAITSKLNTVSFREMDVLQDMPLILKALEKKHKVKITKGERELQIQGFLHGPSLCWQEMSEIVATLHSQAQAKIDAMDLKVGADVEMIDVPDTSEEYQCVVQPFLNTLQDLKLFIDVLQVHKVHNPLLYNQYQLKKLRMVTDPNKPAERVLYHGTNETSAKEICHSGFNRSFCGKNATLYGQGVYFAVESEISTRDHYSPPNKEGKKFVFVARVLTGEYTMGKENMRTPPIMENSGSVPRRYDSLVSNMKNPSIFVIFNDTQAYPEYLITCRKRKDAAK